MERRPGTSRSESSTRERPTSSADGLSSSSTANPAPVHTITADNGTEFHSYADIERVTDTRFYFANPHHAWERGTNENTNGLIRQYLPKKKSMADLTQYDCNAIARKLTEDHENDSDI